MALLRKSPQLRRQFPMPGSNDYIRDWEMYPPNTYGAALQPVDATLRKEPAAGWKLRGSGVHGPESSDVFKHILWNRMKQGRPIRHLPNLEQLQDESKMNIGFIWFLLGLALVHQPMMAWGERYAAVHDHYPWMQKRVDGTKGKGQYTWFFQ